MNLIKKHTVTIETYDYKDDFKLEIYIYDYYYDVYLSKGCLRQLIFTTAKEGMDIKTLMIVLEQVIPTISLQFPYYEDSESLFEEVIEKINVVD